jgi:2'-5' RNA ligase
VRSPVPENARMTPATPGPTDREWRLFIALWPDAGTRDAVAAWRREWHWPAHSALVRPERLHVTLHFLGDVAVERVPELVRSVQVPFHPFGLELGHGEVWPNGVAVLQPERIPAPLAHLQDALGDALARLALPVETRPYRPHITLARRARGANVPPQGPGLHWRIDDGYVLVRSLPGGNGYQVLQRFG